MRKATAKIRKNEANRIHIAFTECELMRMCIKYLDGKITKDVDPEYFIMNLELPDEHDDLAPLIEELCFNRCKYFQKCREQYGDGTKEMETALAHYCKSCKLGSGYGQNDLL